MSTTATIGFNRGNGKATFITVNYDGYQSHTGATLVEHYDTSEKVEELLALGDLSSIGETIDECEAYNRDRNEPWEDVQPILRTPEEESDARYTAYTYIWDGKEWRMNGRVITGPA